eukprot:961197-Rhodomonas_salina.1
MCSPSLLSATELETLELMRNDGTNALHLRAALRSSAGLAGTRSKSVSDMLDVSLGLTSSWKVQKQGTEASVLLCYMVCAVENTLATCALSSCSRILSTWKQRHTLRQHPQPRPPRARDCGQDHVGVGLVAFLHHLCAPRQLRPHAPPSHAHAPRTLNRHVALSTHEDIPPPPALLNTRPSS